MKGIGLNYNLSHRHAGLAPASHIVKIILKLAGMSVGTPYMASERNCGFGNILPFKVM